MDFMGLLLREEEEKGRGGEKKGRKEVGKGKEKGDGEGPSGLQPPKSKFYLQ